MLDADLIWILHMVLICFVVLVPFIGHPGLVLINLIFMIGIAFHWILNNNVCCLTEFESFLRGIDDRSETFFGKLIGPVYGLNNSWSQWIGLLFLITVSVLKLKDAFKKRNDVAHDSMHSGQV
jgi:hypothetical protein